MNNSNVSVGKLLKVLLSGLFLSLAFYLFWHRQWIPYAWKQATGQLAIIWEAQPIDDFLVNPDFPDSLKQQLRIVQAAKRFAIDSLKLSPSGSYEKMYDQKGKPLMWVVTASPAFKMEAFQWDYPIVGKMGYRGFFEKELAIAEEERLKSEGYDTRLRTVGAWSTLGFLNDPVLSGMLQYTEGSLVNTVIHELTHSTIFIWEETSLNENLASFVGDEGAKLFLKDKYGTDSEEYFRYINRKGDRKQFAQYILKSAKRLDSLYNSFPGGWPVAKKEATKQQLIDSIIEGFGSVSLQSERYKKYFEKNRPNNAFFMAYLRYREKQNQFREAFEQDFQSDLKAYIRHLKEKY